MKNDDIHVAVVMDDVMEQQKELEPLVPSYCDCSNLDGFMLNVERLMASELVALSSNEVIGGALLLWCRAWKQKPAASVPDDDRIIAAFARMPLARFRKVRSEILRGFVKCSDGRLYHRTLAAEAVRAFGKKLAFEGRRKKDAERLRKWREKQDATHNETNVETVDETRFETVAETMDETRFVAEGTGTGTGTGTKPCPLSPVPPLEKIKRKTKSVLQTFDEFAADCRATETPAIPEGDPIHGYAEHAGITPEMMRLAWQAMRNRYSGNPKKQIDWRATFRNGVRENWFKIWYVADNGDVLLTTVGKQTEKAMT